MDGLRLKFTKTGRAAFISHLDLMRTMQRSFMRAGLPLKYSEGFNPHAIISIALPLSVGTRSVCELMDFKLRAFMAEKELVYALSRTLPEGLRALDCYEPTRKFKEIKWLEINGRLDYDSRDINEMAAGLTEFFGREKLVIEKKSKSGTAPTDIAPGIHSVQLDTGAGAVYISAVLSAQEPTVKPELLVSALSQLEPSLAPDFAAFRRERILDGEFGEFR
ncbi:MAG: TIGR03936 family radical SAM-associated protein [Oscillospiraceae bacterium]|jgi:radical SAM-linked protein|nr:TIGR03936 family radical SAM-associated protein [Oscillospiraceae bacterium]